MHFLNSPVAYFFFSIFEIIYSSSLEIFLMALLVTSCLELICSVFSWPGYVSIQFNRRPVVQRIVVPGRKGCLLFAANTIRRLPLAAVFDSPPFLVRQHLRFNIIFSLPPFTVHPRTVQTQKRRRTERGGE